MEMKMEFISRSLSSKTLDYSQALFHKFISLSSSSSSPPPRLLSGKARDPLIWPTFFLDSTSGNRIPTRANAHAR